MTLYRAHFLYDRSNIIKKTFVNEINDFLPIMCSVISER